MGAALQNEIKNTPFSFSENGFCLEYLTFSKGKYLFEVVSRKVHRIDEKREICYAKIRTERYSRPPLSG